MNLVGNADSVNLFVYACVNIPLSETNLQIASVGGNANQRVSVNSWMDLWAFLKKILISHFPHRLSP